MNKLKHTWVIDVFVICFMTYAISRFSGFNGWEVASWGLDHPIENNLLGMSTLMIALIYSLFCLTRFIHGLRT